MSRILHDHSHTRRQIAIVEPPRARAVVSVAVYTVSRACHAAGRQFPTIKSRRYPEVRALPAQPTEVFPYLARCCPAPSLKCHHTTPHTQVKRRRRAKTSRGKASPALVPAHPRCRDGLPPLASLQLMIAAATTCRYYSRAPLRSSRTVRITTTERVPRLTVAPILKDNGSKTNSMRCSPAPNCTALKA